jgi:hypothetical protein
MKFRAFVASAVIAGFLSGVPALVHADESHHGLGDYDAHREWHPGGWRFDNHSDWARAHHPEWARNGDWDKYHRWHDSNWWKQHHSRWSHEHHHDWF